MLNTALLSVLLFQSAPGNLTHKEYTEKLVKITATGTVEELKEAIDNGKIFERDRIFDACGLAAKTGRVEIVKFYLENKMVKIDEFIPNTREHQSWTMGDMLIHHAASAPKGNIEMLKLLLEKGADINAKTQNASARTALYFAATKNNEEMFDFLLANKAHADNHLFSDLVAISQKSMNLNKYLKKLLQAGVKIDGYELGLQAIHRVSDIETLKFLLDNGAKIDARARIGFNSYFGNDRDRVNPLGQTELIHFSAKQNTDLEFMKFLLDHGAKVDAIDDLNNQALHYAAQYHKLPLYKLLIERGAKTDYQNHEGKTPMDLAGPIDDAETFVSRADAPIRLHYLEFQIFRGAKIDMVNKKGFQAIHQASINGNWDTLKFLLDHGANINAKDSRGKTPLHHLVESRNYKRDEVLKNLLKLGPKIDEVDENGDQAIHLAASKGNSNCCSILIKNGADIHAKNRNGVEMIDLVKDKNNRDNYLRLFESY
ncbi:MAG: hypothetical protein RL095_463 [Verrucomicrobiota bacterium]|jgi:ankyrin repeat protein